MLQISIYNEALELARKNSDRHNEGNIHSNLGNLYSEIDETNTAITHYKNA